jgi:hypothetical protein
VVALPAAALHTGCRRGNRVVVRPERPAQPSPPPLDEGLGGVPGSGGAECERGVALACGGRESRVLLPGAGSLRFDGGGDASAGLGWSKPVDEPSVGS